MGNGKEEYLHSEKYELRWWDRSNPESLQGLLRELNTIRRDNLALHTLRTLTFHGIDNDELLCFSKTAYTGPSTRGAEPHRSTILVIANLADDVRSGITHLDLTALGVDGDRPFEVHDLMTDRRFTWSGSENYVELHPDEQPGHILRVIQ
jgi:starch synthase (maltosyl-transferring)